MYRKLVISAVSVLGLVTLCVSAQQPVQITTDGQSTNLLPVQVPDLPKGANGAWVFGHGFQGREEMELQRQTEDLVKQLGKAEGEKRDKIRGLLTETLGKQFDRRQKRHEGEIAALEAKVRKLKDVVDKRKENRREIISRRMDQLVRDAEGLGW